MNIRVCELFAGVGGFRVGLENSSKSFDTIWANQWEPGRKTQWAYECYISHFGKDSCVNEDINKIKHLVPDHDLLVGGFPCQDYSVASTGAKGIQGKKGVLWWDIRDIVENKKPRFILLENVDRILKSPAKQRGRDFGIILKSLNDLGYCVEWRVINAADYGGPQRRRRTFIFAYHQSSSFFNSIDIKNKEKVVSSTGYFATTFKSTLSTKKKSSAFSLEEYSNLVEISDNFSFDFLNAGVCHKGKGFTCELSPVEEGFIPLKDILETNKVDSSYFLDNEKAKKFEYLRGSKRIMRTKPNGEPYLYSEGSMSPYDALDLPARTMLTSEGTVNRSSHIVKDLNTDKLRLLTQLECERINGFPDNWTNTGMPQKFRYFCMGNALVVPMITRMGNKIAEIFDIQ